MPLNIESPLIGVEDDVGDIDYDHFIAHMEEYRHNRSLDVGENLYQCTSTRVFFFSLASTKCVVARSRIISLAGAGIVQY
jgi:hypothetical protein